MKLAMITNILRLPIRSEMYPPMTAVSIVPPAYSASSTVCRWPAASSSKPRWSVRKNSRYRVAMATLSETRNRASQAHPKSGCSLGDTQKLRMNSPRWNGGFWSSGSCGSLRMNRNGNTHTTNRTAVRYEPPTNDTTTNVTSPTPITGPSACARPTRPEATPRCRTGTWSGIVAVSPA